MLTMCLALSQKSVEALYDLIPEFLSLICQNITYPVLDTRFRFMVVLIYISLMVNQVQHFLMFLLPICLIGLPRFFAHF